MTGTQRRTSAPFDDRERAGPAQSSPSTPALPRWSFAPLPAISSPVVAARSGALDDDGQARCLEAFGLILQLAREGAGLRFAAIACVTPEIWTACAVSSSMATALGTCQPVAADTTVCGLVRESGRSVVIDQVAVSQHHRLPQAARLYGFQSCISVPIRLADGSFFGTLVGMDPLPAPLSAPKTIALFESLAHLAGLHLDAEERLRGSRAALRDEQGTAELREQFIAVLGHDLRNPLSSIALGAERLARMPLEEKPAALVAQIRRSSERMAKLVVSILDLARGQLGGGMQLQKSVDPGLRELLLQVIAELQSAHPRRVIEVRERLLAPVHCDGERIAQLLSNLVGNALHHGSAERPVVVELSSDAQQLTVAVSNHCAPIPAATLSRLFQPFFRHAGEAGHQGLGLGLYIASQIAQAHGGPLTVRSEIDGTTFTLKVPSAAAAA